MSEKKEKIFDGIWNELDATDRNKVVVKHLKTLSKWDLKRVGIYSKLSVLLSKKD